MKKYFVSVGQHELNPLEDFAIVVASDPEEAKRKFLTYHALNYFKDYACDDFVENFYYDDNGKFVFTENRTDEEATGIIEQRIKEFFAERPDYAQIYINGAFSEKGEVFNLPDEVLEFMLLKHAPRYFGKDKPVVIDVEDITIGGDS